MCLLILGTCVYKLLVPDNRFRVYLTIPNKNKSQVHFYTRKDYEEDGLASGTLDFLILFPASGFCLALSWPLPLQMGFLHVAGRTQASWLHYQSPEAGDGFHCRFRQKKS